jgi:hypothetical protein
MKRMTIVISGVLLITISMFIAKKVLGAGEPQINPSVGRFQLFQGTYSSLDAKNNRADKETEVFLLDTSTGKVQRYVTGIHKDGKFFEGWLDTNANGKSE